MANIKLSTLLKGILPFLLVEIALLFVFILIPQLILIPMKYIAG